MTGVAPPSTSILTSVYELSSLISILKMKMKDIQYEWEEPPALLHAQYEASRVGET